MKERRFKMYTTQRYHSTISVSDYLEHYVDVETFLEKCRECPNYGEIWSCPPYDFDAREYWKQYKTLELTAVKINFDEEYACKPVSQEEAQRIIEDSLWNVKTGLSAELLEKERANPGSVSLSAGSCHLCRGKCGKVDNEPCRFPEKMRYSIEALGGNVGLTISKLMGIELEWMEEGKLPHYFVLVCGLLLRQG